ncbi:MAG: glutamate-semialdehyde -aminomutase, partial [Pseudonocardiales bacterium]|nr:glutamate-semialdehyde -aminomutase [Pseudonocardiales bacterium]
MLPGGNTRTTLFFAPFPITMQGGAGCTLTDVDGHDYIDLLGEYT